MKDKAEVLYHERKIAERLGITRDQISYVRKKTLKEKKHWRQEGREIVYTTDGLDKFASYLGVEFSHLDIAACLVPAGREKKQKGLDPAKPPNSATQLTVKRCFPNPRLLMATDPGGNQVRVRVPTNVNFKPNMKLHGSLVSEGFYKLEGRCPRFPGRY